MKQRILSFLADHQHPTLNRSWADMGVLGQVIEKKGKLSISLDYGFPIPTPDRARLKENLCTFARSLPGIQEVTVTEQLSIRAHAVQPNVTAHPRIRNVIAVGSGKGGVGKSTTAVNLALALSRCGARVGLLDADIYGPNIPQMLGATEGPDITEDKKWLPVLAQGLYTHSIGYLVDPDTPTVWRGPMVSGALMQLMSDTVWPELDYLVVDLPPGTGDVQLTMAKKIPVSAAVMVSTPQAVALQDVKKGIAMLRKVEIPLAGLVENMSYFECGQCGARTDIFATGGAERLARELSIPFLGAMPLLPLIREASDTGQPLTPDMHAMITERYDDMALALGAWIANRPRGYSQHFGSIDVQAKD